MLGGSPKPDEREQSLIASYRSRRNNNNPYGNEAIRGQPVIQHNRRPDSRHVQARRPFVRGWPDTVSGLGDEIHEFNCCRIVIFYRACWLDTAGTAYLAS